MHQICHFLVVAKLIDFTRKCCHKMSLAEIALIRFLSLSQYWRPLKIWKTTERIHNSSWQNIRITNNFQKKDIVKSAKLCWIPCGLVFWRQSQWWQNVTTDKREQFASKRLEGRVLQFFSCCIHQLWSTGFLQSLQTQQTIEILTRVKFTVIKNIMRIWIRKYLVLTNHPVFGLNISAE